MASLQRAPTELEVCEVCPYAPYSAIYSYHLPRPWW